jgi:hypothetical protein
MMEMIINLNYWQVVVVVVVVVEVAGRMHT